MTNVHESHKDVVDGKCRDCEATHEKTAGWCDLSQECLMPPDRRDPNAVPFSQRPVEYYKYEFPQGKVFTPIAPEGTIMRRETAEDDAHLENFLRQMFGKDNS